VPGPPEPVKLLSIFHNAQTSSAKGSRSEASSVARHILAKGLASFPLENLWGKMPRRAVFPAFRGSAPRSIAASGNPPSAGPSNRA